MSIVRERDEEEEEEGVDGLQRPREVGASKTTAKIREQAAPTQTEGERYRLAGGDRLVARSVNDSVRDSSIDMSARLLSGYVRLREERVQKRRVGTRKKYGDMASVAN
ncbi:LOW QUALITY PROTEIN: hypothetical protein Dda_5488 [Drechslerella dactyloides]|uniref:Uncharacterized protein n=1 Tax=Drechslerella dactyloides TaxID=74499 RepID=A0AAD6J0E5_DREDA|nr:LOW QUALITY PROTEIN: hypothetical protein Dda_5488 [Drechslerella dactyloides]